MNGLGLAAPSSIRCRRRPTARPCRASSRPRGLAWANESVNTAVERSRTAAPMPAGSVARRATTPSGPTPRPTIRPTSRSCARTTTGPSTWSLGCSAARAPFVDSRSSPARSAGPPRTSTATIAMATSRTWQRCASGDRVAVSDHGSSHSTGIGRWRSHSRPPSIVTPDSASRRSPGRWASTERPSGAGSRSTRSSLDLSPAAFREINGGSLAAGVIRVEVSGPIQVPLPPTDVEP